MVADTIWLRAESIESANRRFEIGLSKERDATRRT